VCKANVELHRPTVCVLGWLRRRRRLQEAYNKIVHVVVEVRLLNECVDIAPITEAFAKRAEVSQHTRRAACSEKVTERGDRFVVAWDRHRVSLNISRVGIGFNLYAVGVVQGRVAQMVD
jgi:hypothetical protein